MKPAGVLGLVRRRAREHELKLRDLPGRGKGSHRIFVLEDRAGTEVARFGMTGHSRELSWTLLTQLEDGLAHVFGTKWMEDR